MTLFISPMVRADRDHLVRLLRAAGAVPSIRPASDSFPWAVGGPPDVALGVVLRMVRAGASLRLTLARTEGRGLPMRLCPVNSASKGGRRLSEWWSHEQEGELRLLMRHPERLEERGRAFLTVLFKAAC